jgi:ABC-2 type transport system permease protein
MSSVVRRPSLFLRNVFLKSLRDSRWTLLWWGLALGVLLASTFFGTYAAYPRAADRMALVQQLLLTAPGLRLLVGDTVGTETIGGFTIWRVGGLVALLLGMYGATAGSYMVRGEEERGLLDVALSTPVGRARLLLAKFGAFAVVVTGILLLAGLLFYLGSLSVSESSERLAILPALGQALLWGPSTLLLGALALLAGQVLPSRRSALVAAAIYLVASFFVGNVASLSKVIEPLRFVSALWYASRSRAIVPGLPVDWAALGVLLSATFAFLITAVVAFERRDLGAGLVRLAGRRTSAAARKSVTRTPLLGSVFGLSLRDALWPHFFWALGIALYAGGIAALTPALVEALRDQSDLLKLLSQFGVSDEVTTLSILQLGVFSLLPAALAVYAVTQLTWWSGEEDEGRFDILLSTPLPRWRPVLERFGAVLVALLAVLAVDFLVTLGIARVLNLQVQSGRLFEAYLASLPVTLFWLGLGFLIAGRFRGGRAVGVVGGLAVVTFFVEYLGPLLKLPEVVRRLSPFFYYDQPLLGQTRWAELLVMTALAALCLAGSALAFQRRDLGG